MVGVGIQNVMSEGSVGMCKEVDGRKTAGNEQAHNVRRKNNQSCNAITLFRHKP